MRLKAIGGNIILDPTPRETKTKGGIIIPPGDNEDGNTGTVIAVGTGREIGGDTYPMQTKVGDVVVFGENSTVPFEVDGKKYIVMREADVFSVLE